MNTITITLLIAVAAIGLAFAGIGIKMFFKKGASFERHCASEEAGKRENCVCNGDEQNCRYRAIHHPVESVIDDNSPGQ